MKYDEKENIETTLTFQLTDACNLRCTYCYQINKQHNFLTKENADKIIDKLFSIDKSFFKDYFDNEYLIEKNGEYYLYNINLDFIGGEPLLYIDMMKYITEKIEKKINDNDIPTKITKITINSNGTLVDTPKVLEYCEKYNDIIDYAITLDGCKEAHDMCRKDINGNGSFDKTVQAYKIIREKLHKNPHTRLTISPQNLQYLYKSFLFLVEEMNIPEVFAIYQKEDVWTEKDAEKYMDELLKIGNYLLNHSDCYYTTLDDPFKTQDVPRVTCGLYGAQIAFDANGNVFNCFRYSECTSNKREILSLGNINDKSIKKGRLKLLRSAIGKKFYNNEKCKKCSEFYECQNEVCPSFSYQHTGHIHSMPIYENNCLMLKAQNSVKEEYQRLKVQKGFNIAQKDFYNKLKDE